MINYLRFGIREKKWVVSINKMDLISIIKVKIDVSNLKQIGRDVNIYFLSLTFRVIIPVTKVPEGGGRIIIASQQTCHHYQKSCKVGCPLQWLFTILNLEIELKKPEPKALT